MARLVELRYVGGVNTWSPTFDDGQVYCLTADADALQLHHLQSTLLKPRWVPSHRFPWPEIESVDVSTQFTGPTLAALAFLGVLALAAHQPPGALVSLTATGGRASFYTDVPRAQAVGAIEQVVGVEHRGVLRVEGQPLVPGAAPGRTVQERLHALEELLKQGLLSDVEYAAQRQRILESI